MTGPAFIYREQQQRYIPVKFSVRGRDLGSTVLHWNHCDSKESVCQGREVDVEQYAAMIGGIFALVVTGTPFSVSAAIGFIALFGIAVMCP